LVAASADPVAEDPESVAGGAAAELELF